MKRPAKPLFLVLLPSLILWSAGCQRSMTGSMATGPFAPAGSMAPAGNSPLIPIGPVSGATRVPPPSTGSSSPSNGYLGAPSASTFDARAATTLQANTGSTNSNANSGLGATQFNPNTAMTPQPPSFRDSLGGMPVNDLTNQGPVPTIQAPPTSFAGSYPPAVVGSGVAYPTPSAAAETSAWAQQPSDLLRPIEVPYAAIPVPRYRGMEPTPQQYAPAVQPAGGFAAADSWQTTQPNYPSTPSSPPSVIQTSLVPSTDPVGTGRPTYQSAGPPLPWRSPTTAR